MTTKVLSPEVTSPEEAATAADANAVGVDEATVATETGAADAADAANSVAPDSQHLNVAKQLVKGTILEAAFVDSAYSFPPAEGQGKNAIELQATTLQDDEKSDHTSESLKRAMIMPTKPKPTTPTPKSTVKPKKSWGCCKNNNAVVDTSEPRSEDASYKAAKESALTAQQIYKVMKKEKEREKRKEKRTERVPEGILIYKLDTANHTIELLSKPHSNTNMETLLTSMIVASAIPSDDATRRGIVLTGIDGSTATLVACEQRTAIAWMEAVDMMLGHKTKSKAVKASATADGTKVRQSSFLRVLLVTYHSLDSFHNHNHDLFPFPLHRLSPSKSLPTGAKNT